MRVRDTVIYNIQSSHVPSGDLQIWNKIELGCAKSPLEAAESTPLVRPTTDEI